MDIDNPAFNEMQSVKRHFFAMRNGVIADVLRRGGSPFRIIFGLNLPQLVDIAAASPHSAELALRLWQNNSTRESMLLAPMLMPREVFSFDDALKWVSEVPAFEVADILCHRLLRHLPFAEQLTRQLITAEDEMTRYTGVRLACNLQYSLPALASEVREQILSSHTDDAASRLASTTLGL